MSQETISVGSAPDDGTGDTLRASFTKINSNFTEVYSSVSGLTTDLTTLSTTVSGLSFSLSTLSSSLAITSGKTLTVLMTLSLTGTDGTTMTFPATSATIARTDAGQTFTGTNVFGVTQLSSVAIGGATIGSNALAVTGTANISGAISASGGIIMGTASIQSSGAISFGASSDLAIVRDAADTLAQRRGPNAQTLNIYNTYTDASNYERVSVNWTGNAFTIDAQAAGTGVARGLRLKSLNSVVVLGTPFTVNTSAGVEQWRFGSSGALSNTSYTLGDQAQVFAITATQPASPTGLQRAVRIDVTGAGSASQSNMALWLSYTGAYTGTSNTWGQYVDAAVTGTASVLIPSAGSNDNSGNFGSVARVYGPTTGANIAIEGRAEAGNLNAGVVGLAQTAKNSATNIGVVGSAINTGTSPVMVGGFFSLNQTTVPTVSAALIADNASSAQVIFRARAAGSDVFVIGSSGNLSSSAGVVTFSNTAMTMQAGAQISFGGTNSSSPMVKRSTTTLQARLADDSAFTNIQGKITTDTAYTAGAITDTGYLTIYDSTGTAYKVACVAA